jgi:hypothetical protein
MNTDLPFIYETYYDAKQNTTTKKMYNRGPIMSDAERLQIRDWANLLIFENKMKILPHGRLDYIIYDNNPDVIPIVIEIMKRIEVKYDLASFERETKIKDFLAVIPTGGFIHKHCDPNIWERGLFHIRFNVFISLPKKGGDTYYDGQIIDSVEGSYVLCRSGIDMHWSDPNEDIVPRISLSFGYLLPPEKIDDLCKDPYFGVYKRYYPLTLNKPVQLTTKIVVEERGHEGSGTNIFTISNIFTTMECEIIVDYITKNSALWDERDVGYDSGNNVECKFLTLKDLIPRGIPGAKEIDDLIFERVGAILNAFRAFRPEFKGIHDDGYTLRKIFGGTKRHVDGVHSKTGGFTKFVRALSFIAVLNDDYDGGIFNFPTQNLKIKVKKGEVILFPPYWTHPHYVTRVGEGQARYTINTWILENFIG